LYLVTNAREFYALSVEGEVLKDPKIRGLERKNVIEPIFFKSVSRARRIEINYA